ncbi:MAG: Zn-ribbon domain-containing OB-fold protein [Dehalococcoidia bacterium]
MTQQTYKKPLPVVHPDNEPYWTALKAHELRMQRCTDCNTLRYPVSPVCWKCLSEGVEWEQLSGRGTLGTWIVVEQVTGNPAWSEDVPFIVALVNLEEGPRLTTNIVGIEPDQLAYGMPLEIVFDDVTAEITLAKFKPAA